MQLKTGTASIESLGGSLEIRVKDSQQLLQTLESRLAFHPELSEEVMTEVTGLLNDHATLRTACEPMLPATEVSSQACLSQMSDVSAQHVCMYVDFAADLYTGALTNLGEPETPG